MCGKCVHVYLCLTICADVLCDIIYGCIIVSIQVSVWTMARGA